MAAQFSLQSVIDCKNADENDALNFSNFIGFKRFIHSDTGLNVNLANVSGPLYTLAVVVPVLHLQKYFRQTNF